MVGTVSVRSSALQRTPGRPPRSDDGQPIGPIARSRVVRRSVHPRLFDRAAAAVPGFRCGKSGRFLRYVGYRTTTSIVRPGRYPKESGCRNPLHYPDHISPFARKTFLPARQAPVGGQNPRVSRNDTGARNAHIPLTNLSGT